MKSLRERLRIVNESLDKVNKEEKDFIVKLLKSGKIQKNVTTVPDDISRKTTQPADPTLVDDFVKWALKEYIGMVEDWVINQDNEDSFYKIFCSEMEERNTMGLDGFWEYLDDKNIPINFTLSKYIDDEFEYVYVLLQVISGYIADECQEKFNF